MSMLEFDATDIEFNDPPEIKWVLVREAVQFIWADNAKNHDLGAIVASIERNGFKELPKFDKNLPNIRGGQGAIQAGNGRIEALHSMEVNNRPLPRGLGVDHNGYWIMPILFGTDSKNLAEAQAYAIDSNVLTLLGGDFGPHDIIRLHDQDKLVSLLQQLDMQGVMPVTIDSEDLASMVAFMNGVFDDDEEDGGGSSESGDGEDEDDGSDTLETINARIPVDLYDQWLDITEEFGESDEDRMIGWIKQYQRKSKFASTN